MSNKNNEIAVKTSSNILPALSSERFEELKKIGEDLVSSQMFPIKKPNEAIAAIVYGRTLGFDEVTSLNNVYNVNNRATLNRDLIATLLIRNGIDFEVVKEYEPVYTYTDSYGVGVSEIDIIKNPDSFQIFTPNCFDGNNLKPNIKQDETKRRLVRKTTMIVLRGANVPDMETIIRFEGVINGKNKVIYYSYKLSDAINEKLIDKDNWIKMPSTMVYTRCLTNGSRRIAPHVFMGVYEYSELADSANIPYKINEEGIAEPIIQDIPHEIVEEGKK